VIRGPCLDLSPLVRSRSGGGVLGCGRTAEERTQLQILLRYALQISSKIRREGRIRIRSGGSELFGGFMTKLHSLLTLSHYHSLSLSLIWSRWTTSLESFSYHSNPSLLQHMHQAYSYSPLLTFNREEGKTNSDISEFGSWKGAKCMAWAISNVNGRRNWS
jgi:hypothetical protein